ncbi:MAG: hypothetical protein FJ392_05625 [Verrucomicrobia bacterium]|nr:hypothetical protein [Verrucomicrobiota bacterium]
MNARCLKILIAVVCVATSASACRKKSAGHSNSDFERAASKFAVADPAPTAEPPPTGAPPAPAPAQEMQQAVQAYKGGQFEDAVVRLQRLRATPAMSGQQRMALNDAMAAVMTDIYALAAKGDPRAIQAVKQYEQLQTQRR